QIAEVVIARLDGQPTGLALGGEPVDDGRGGDVGQEDGLAAVEDGGGAAAGLTGVLGCVTFRFKEAAVIAPVGSAGGIARLAIVRLPTAAAAGTEERALAVFLERVGHARLPPLRLALQLGGQLLSRAAVNVARDAADDALGVLVLDVPLAGAFP